MFFDDVNMPAAALIAFVALGANLLGTGLLLMLNPRSRSVRWHAAFTFWIMAWLGLQGWFTISAVPRTVVLAYGYVVHLMPAFFFGAALVETRGARDRVAALPILAAILTAPWLNPLTGAPLATLWQALMWGVPAMLHFSARRDRPVERRPAPGEGALKLVLLVIVPVAVIGVIMLGGAFLLYVMPLITILIQFLIFTGVIHHRFYDIEVRAARSGELAARAAEQERLALLGELSATLAHEIRNPLTGIRSLAQRLGGSGIDDARRARYGEVILGEIGRLDRIVGGLLDVARRRSVRDEPGAATPLAPLFDDVALLVDARARRADVELAVEAAGLVAGAPRDALAQTLLNLLLNAIDHTPPGGRVRLEAQALDGRVEVRVRDGGAGVPAEARERIFEPFQGDGTGAGLGLSVVRRIARELDWQIAVEDAEGGGALFRLRLPVPAGEAHA